jgi:hypothetical protein
MVLAKIKDKNEKEINNFFINMSNANLKDFFVPHPGNNYKPHALHLKRLAGHTVGALLIKVIVVLSVLSLPTAAWLTPDLEFEQSEEIISLTNQIRQEKQLPILVENSKLTQAALLKAEDMLANQYFAHVGPDKKSLKSWLDAVGYTFTAAGENLAMGFASPEAVIQAWKNSKTHYANIIDPDYREIGVGIASGKYLGSDTSLVAQYFGQAEKQSVLAKNSDGVSSIPASDIMPASYDSALVDNNQSNIYVMSSGDDKEAIIRVVAYLNSEAKEARVDFNGFLLQLTEDPVEPNRWFGNLFLSGEEKEKIFTPVIPPVITVIDSRGQELRSDMKIDGAQPVKPSLLSQYLYAKKNQNKYLAPLFAISSVYYKFLAIFLIIILAINIFVEIKKQHPHIIASALGVLGILSLLIIL